MIVLLITLNLFFNITVGEEYVIVLNNGRKIIAEVVSKSDSELTYKRKGVTLSLKFSDIRSIKKNTRAKRKIKKSETDKKSKKSNVELANEDELKKLIAKAKAGAEKDLDLLIEKAGDKLPKVVKKNIDVKKQSDAKFVLKLLKRSELTDKQSKMWMLFMSFAEDAVIESGFEYLIESKNTTKSCMLGVMSLVYGKKNDSKIVKYSVKKLMSQVDFKKINNEDKLELKTLVISRTKVGPSSCRVFSSKLLFEYFSNINKGDIETLMKSNEIKIRMMALREGVNNRIKDVNKSLLTALYVNSKNSSEKIRALKFMDQLKVFIEDEDKEFFRALYEDMKLKQGLLKGNERRLAKMAFIRLKLDSKKKFPIRSQEWKEYLK